MNIVHLSSVHPSDDIRIFQKECRSLAASGFQVGFIVASTEAPSDQSVRVVTIPKPTSRLQRMARVPFAIFSHALRSRGRIFHFHDPELIPVGILLKLCGRQVVYDVHENVPEDIMTKEYIPYWLRSALSMAVGALEIIGAAIFDRIVTATGAIAEHFPKNKTVVVQNFPFLNELGGAITSPYAQRPPRFIYAGVITRIRGANEMVEAMAKLKPELAAELYLVGKYESDALKAKLEASPGFARTKALGWQTRTQMAGHLATARAGLVLFHPGPNHTDSQPNKLFEYMSAGLPVIASNFPRWREIVEGVGCGLCVDPQDPASIASAMDWILTHPAEAEEMGRRGREAVLSRFNWEKESEKLISMYRTLLPEERA